MPCFRCPFERCLCSFSMKCFRCWCCEYVILSQNVVFLAFGLHFFGRRLRTQGTRFVHLDCSPTSLPSPPRYARLPGERLLFVCFQFRVSVAQDLRGRQTPKVGSCRFCGKQKTSSYNLQKESQTKDQTSRRPAAEHASGTLGTCARRPHARS